MDHLQSYRGHPSPRSYRAPRSYRSPPSLRSSRAPLSPLLKTTLLLKDEIHVDEQHATMQKYPTPSEPYHEAYKYVEDYRNWRSRYNSTPSSYEDFMKPRSIKMSEIDWAKLSSSLNLDESDEVYPSLSYNAATSTLIIQCMPSPLHESVVSLLNKRIIAAQLKLPRDVERSITTQTGRDYKRFEGRWEGSKKKPDLAIQVKNAAGNLEVKWVLEIGFSETYNDLVDDTKLWLEGRSDVSTVILIKIKETPRYQCPISLDDDLNQLGIPLTAVEVLFSDVICTGEYGPATYRGKTWVGEISEVIMEVWKRDTNGSAKKYKEKNLLDDTHHSIQFRLIEFLDQRITVDLKEFRDLLKDDIKELAVDRCCTLLGEYKKRMGEGLDDPDYQPGLEV